MEAREVLCAQCKGVVVADEFHQHAADEEDEIFNIRGPVLSWHYFGWLVLRAHLLR